MVPGHVAATPNPSGEYDVIKTPGSSSGHRRFGPSPWSTKYWYLGSVAQLVIVLSVVAYVYGQIGYFAPYYASSLSKTIGEWWGVPKVTTKNASKGHSEMTRPTYFFLFTVIP
ncbi:hypothetical protein Gpo141_00014390, partial [Globisporangium polare]